MIKSYIVFVGRNSLGPIKSWSRKFERAHGDPLPGNNGGPARKSKKHMYRRVLVFVGFQSWRLGISCGANRAFTIAFMGKSMGSFSHRVGITFGISCGRVLTVFQLLHD